MRTCVFACMGLPTASLFLWFEMFLLWNLCVFLYFQGFREECNATFCDDGCTIRRRRPRRTTTPQPFPPPRHGMDAKPWCPCNFPPSLIHMRPLRHYWFHFLACCASCGACGCVSCVLYSGRHCVRRPRPTLHACQFACLGVVACVAVCHATLH
jgi:hypothetical protein